VCFENTAVNYVANFQYLFVCLVFSISKPFRQPLYTNLWFSVSLLVLLGMNTYQVVSDDTFITSLLDLEASVDMRFRLWTLVIVGVNALVTYLYERVVVWYVSIWARNRVEERVRKDQLREIEGQRKEMQRGKSL
jgi:cation-transporting ATPase 13A2